MIEHSVIIIKATPHYHYDYSRDVWIKDSQLDDAREWCDKNTENEWSWRERGGVYIFTFHSEQDAFIFKLMGF